MRQFLHQVTLCGNCESLVAIKNVSHIHHLILNSRNGLNEYMKVSWQHQLGAETNDAGREMATNLPDSGIKLNVQLQFFFYLFKWRFEFLTVKTHGIPGLVPSPYSILPQQC